MPTFKSALPVKARRDTTNRLTQDSSPAKPPSSRTVEDALRPHRKALAALIRTPAVSAGDTETALAQLTEVAVEVLGVERASVWRLEGERSRIVCVNMFERKARKHSRGLALARQDAPRYFDALDEERSIAVVNAATDPRTRDFAASYLDPHRIGAMLDAPIFVGPELVGVVCHEHVGGTRAWKLWEELVASTLADFVALVLANAERMASERELDAYRKHLEQLVEERTAKLRETELGLSKLFEASPVPMLLARAANHDLVLVNRRASDLFGLAESPSKRLADIWVDPDDGERLTEMSTRSHHSDGFQSELRGKNGPFFAELAVERITFSGDDCVLLGVHDLTRQREAEATLRELATRDGLTGVLNRRRFMEIAEREALRADRYGKPLSLAMLDVDRFKDVNDRYGHATGDTVLKLLAGRLTSEVRKVDVVARWGGEEFVVLFPETERESAERVVQRLFDAIRLERFDTSEGLAKFTVSIGLVEHVRDEAIEATIERADRAMYAAKQSGRDRVVVG